MNRMAKILGDMQKRHEKILVLYFPVGDTIVDPDAEWAEKYFINGATVLEIGLPYRIPYLDGKVVTDSMKRASGRYNTDGIFNLIAEMRKRCPNQILQVMTYYGNIAYEGVKVFAEKCAKAGVDGVLAPDIPADQWEMVSEALEQHGVLCLHFVPFHCPDESLEMLRKAKGYLFLQAVDGATGVQGSLSPQIAHNIKKLKAAGITVPIIPGFGIGTPEQAGQVFAMGADGVVIGSAVVNSLAEHRGETFIHQLRLVADLSHGQA